MSQDGNEARFIRGQECNNRSHVGRLGDPLERLHTQHGGTTFFRPGQIRHAALYEARRNRVHADAARAQGYG